MFISSCWQTYKSKQMGKWIKHNKRRIYETQTIIKCQTIVCFYFERTLFVVENLTVAWRVGTLKHWQQTDENVILFALLKQIELFQPSFWVTLHKCAHLMLQCLHATTDQLVIFCFSAAAVRRLLCHLEWFVPTECKCTD